MTGFAPAKPAYMPSMAITWAQRLKRVSTGPRSDRYRGLRSLARGNRRAVAESAFTQFDQQGRQRVVTAEQGVGINPFVPRLDNGRI